MLGIGGPNANLTAISLSHVGARWYQADVGRFAQRDPVGLLGGNNAYNYVLGNPLTSTDPSGLIPEFPGFPIGGWLPPLRPGWRWTNWPPGSNKWIPHRPLPVIQPTSWFGRFLRFLGPLSRFLPAVGAAMIINDCVEAAKAAQPAVNDALEDAAENFWNARLRISQRGLSGPAIKSGGIGAIE